MKQVVRTDKFAIFDDVFKQDLFDTFVRHFCEIDFVKHNQNLIKVWKISDGEIFGGESHSSKKFPFNSPLDFVHNTVYYLAKNNIQDLVGKEGEEWTEIIYRPYIYPVGTKISWHNDSGYTAACIFYCHREWSPFWGGELMIANTPNSEQYPELKSSPDDLFSKDYTKPFLNYFGFGQYITPIPNRMVFTKGGVWHGINRVDVAAGENLRFSIVAFFK